MPVIARIFRLVAAITLVAVAVPAFAQTSASDFTAAVRYDDMNRIVGTIAPDPDGTTGSLHYAATRTTYDIDGRATRVETGELAAWQSEGVAPSAWSGFTIFGQVDTEYDSLDRKVKVTLSSGGAPYSVTQYSYDAVGRLDCTAVRMKIAAFGSLPSSACVLGATVAGDDPDRITKNVYDDVGQVLRVIKAFGINPANGFSNLQQDYVTYTYSPNGKPLTVKDADGNLAGYTYDGFDRQVAWAFPSKTTTGAIAPCTIGTISEASDSFGVLVSGPTGASTSGDDCEKYSYDRNGNRAKMVKRDGRAFAYNYDNLGRPIVKIVPGTCIAGFACTTPPSSAVRNVYYSYDARGQQLYARFDSATGADTVDNTYDGFGRLSSQTTAMYGVSRTVGYLYDADGNRIRITHPDTVYFTTDYDGLDRAITVKENGSTAIATMAYDAQGREMSETRGPVATSFGYDGVSRLSSLTDDLPGGTTNDLTTTLSYSPASQIISRIRSNPTPYAFGGYVNVSRAYVANGLNQYATVAGATLGYDSNGNLVSDGTTSYGYDAENRLVTTTFGAGYTFAYDPLGRLYGGAASAGKSSVYDGDQRIVDYTVDPAVIQYRYVMGRGTDNPLLWYAGSTLSDRRALQADERGSIVSVVDAAGALYGINTYDEYGIPGSANAGRYGYTGQVWISSVGMWYYKARFYSPTLGRFMQTDPIGYADQNNLYAYVGNDPMDGSDPSGLEASTPTSGPNCPGTTGSIGCNGSASPGGAGIWTRGNASLAGNPGPLTKGGQAGRGGDGRPLSPLDNDPPPPPPPLPILLKVTSVLGAILSFGGDSCPGCNVTLKGILKNPETLRDVTLDQVRERIGTPNGWAWTRSLKGSKAGEGWALRQWGGRDWTGRQIRWHPGGGRHGPDPYWRVNNGSGQSPEIPSGGRW